MFCTLQNPKISRCRVNWGRRVNMSTATYGRGAENLVSPQTVSKITNALTIYATSNMECWKKVREKSRQIKWPPSRNSVFTVSIHNDAELRGWTGECFPRKNTLFTRKWAISPPLTPNLEDDFGSWPLNGFRVHHGLFKMTKQCGQTVNLI